MPDPYNAAPARPYRIEAVIFDFDGTLTRPGALDFPKIKSVIGCPATLPVLEYMETITDPVLLAKVHQQLEDFELEGAAASRPNTGAQNLVKWIKKTGLPVGVLTRNSRVSVVRAMEYFSDFSLEDIDVLVTREDPARIKPSGEGIHLIARQLGIPPAHILMVGDGLFDMDAGRDAGSLTAYLSNRAPLPDGLDCDVVVDTLNQLKSVITDGLALSVGKLPNAFLDDLLRQYHVDDPSVIVGPSVGEDTAAVDITGNAVLVLKSDPITFATEDIGRYAVLINANDLATAGASARWMLSTLLLPQGFSRSQVKKIFADLHNACAEQNITLCGGHTEITDAVRRPVVSGMMTGTLSRTDLIQKRRMMPGDRVLVTKGAGVEGTAIIAAEFRSLLLEKGMPAAEIDAAARFQDWLSILPEARIAWQEKGISALHDVTEGGMATALWELSQAGGKGLRIFLDRIPVFPETRRISELLGIDPLGLIGSGSLIIACQREPALGLTRALGKKDIQVTDIGEVTSSEPGIQAMEKKRSVPWPVFEVDEITRLFRTP